MPFGRGFGFRGWSPPWPYVGLGRGGLPRCWAYGSPPLPWGRAYASPFGFGPYPYGFPQAPGAYGVDVDPDFQMYPGYPYAPNPWESPYASSGMTPEGEREWLKNQAESIKQEIDQIKNRISELEKE